jgi:hypothetical protein
VPIIYPLITGYLSNITPTKGASFSFSAPYILSIKPNKIDDKSNTISLNTINGTMPKLPILLSVINPDVIRLLANQTTLGNHTFPTEFSPILSLPRGIYETVLVDEKNDKLLASVKFNVTAPTSDLLQFNAPFYLPILIIVLIPALALVLKFVVDERAKNEGRTEKNL